MAACFTGLVVSVIFVLHLTIGGAQFGEKWLEKVCEEVTAKTTNLLHGFTEEDFTTFLCTVTTSYTEHILLWEQNDEVMGEICSCFQYVPERTMNVFYICMDKHVPSVGRELPRYFREICRERSLYNTVNECIVAEDEGAMQQYRDEGQGHMECTKSVFAKYQIEFEFPQMD